MTMANCTDLDFDTNNIDFSEYYQLRRKDVSKPKAPCNFLVFSGAATIANGELEMAEAVRVRVLKMHSCEDGCRLSVGDLVLRDQSISV